MSDDALANLLQEDRSFAPSPAFAAQANAQASMYDAAAADRLAFWAEQARRLEWAQPWTEVLDWSDAPFARWFVDGKLNVAYNCVDRHVESGHGDQVALHFEGEPGDTRDITYAELQREVSKAAHALTELGVTAGDRVAIYMPMIPEAVVAMLACARIGAPHSVVFAGFSAEALRSRIDDAQATLVITADGQNRRGAPMPLKPAVDEAIEHTPSVSGVLVVRRTGGEVTMKEGRDVWWHDIVDRQPDVHEAQAFDSEHPLFILYTSGSTGKPKGILHTTGGYLTQTASTTKYIFDLREDDVYWCTADVGWITGHSYLVYGPLANGATCLMYEGAPNWPEPDRFWKIIEEFGVTILYTAPTAIRAFMKWGDDWPKKHDLSSLRLLGTVGEPINPEAWMWYYKHIGQSRCPIVDTWWQTETGAIMISPLPGVTPLKPGTATLPFFGIDAAIVDDNGKEVGPLEGGKLVIRKPWPSMLRTIYGDKPRYRKQYWSEVKGCYFTGDGARRDNDGYFWIVGRIDDVLNVAGHRLGTAEVESALVSHPEVAEAAVVGRPDEIKGQAVVAFVTLRSGHKASNELAETLRRHVAHSIGAIAKPDDIRFAEVLPKTRSGKIMRRLLKQVAAGTAITGDTTTLEDFSVLTKLRSADE